MSNELTKVHVVETDEAVSPAKEVFQHFIDTKGGVPNWARVMANKPEILAAFAGLMMKTMGPGLVEQDNKWKCAYRVSDINKCHYCLGVVEGMLKQLGVSEEDMQYVLGDVEQMSADEKAAVLYAEAVTKDAVNVPEEVMADMKKYYDDAQIVEITAAIGLFNYINKFNDALGVLPESH